MDTLLVDPPFERSVWFSKKMEDFKHDVKFSQYLYDYGRAVTLSRPQRVIEVMEAAGLMAEAETTDQSLFELVEYVNGLDTSLAALEDRLAVLLYILWLRRHKGMWPGPEGDSHVWTLGCNTAFILVHWINKHFGVKS
jgi:hypothetical protein